MLKQGPKSQPPTFCITFSMSSPFLLFRYHFSPFLHSLCWDLKHPAHLTDLSWELQAELYNWQRNLLSSQPTTFILPQCWLMTELRSAQCYQEEHITRNTCIWVCPGLPSKAALPQVSITMPPSLRAPWGPQKHISRWIHILSLTTCPLFVVWRDGSKQVCHRGHSVGLYSCCATSPKRSGQKSRQREPAGLARAVISLPVSYPPTSSAIVPCCSPARGSHCWRANAGETVPGDFSALSSALDLIQSRYLVGRNQGNGM